MLLVATAGCGRVGYETSARQGARDGATDPDGTSAAFDAAGWDAIAWDATADDPCRELVNWSCEQEGGGDCIATCESPAGTFALDIFSASSDFYCSKPSGDMVSCIEPVERNCAGCMEMAQALCCFL